MSPLYTAGEKAAIMRFRKMLRSKRSPADVRKYARDMLIVLGIHASRRSWRRKCAEAEAKGERRGMLRAAEIAYKCCTDPNMPDIEQAIRKAAEEVSK